MQGIIILSIMKIFLKFVKRGWEYWHIWKKIMQIQLQNIRGAVQCVTRFWGTARSLLEFFPKIKGKHSSPAKILLVVNSGLECDSAVVPYCLVDHFASVISVHNFSPTFLNRLSSREAVFVPNFSINDEVYFVWIELCYSLL